MSAFLFALAWLILGVLIGLYAQGGHVDLEAIGLFFLTFAACSAACAMWIRRRL